LISKQGADGLWCMFECQNVPH